MVLDEGWQISLRIHTAKDKIESSLKFDIQLIGNPPVLFTQHLFNLDKFALRFERKGRVMVLNQLNQL